MTEQILLGNITMDCKDPKSLSDFYIRMLGWERPYELYGGICNYMWSCEGKGAILRPMDRND